MIDISKIEKIKSVSDIDKESKVNEATVYLKETDWYIVRKIETGKEVPDDILTKRDAARDVISLAE